MEARPACESTEIDGGRLGLTGLCWHARSRAIGIREQLTTHCAPSVSPMLRIFTDAPRWLLLLSLVYAPWAFGCTRAWTIEVLNGLLAAALLLWLLGCALRRVLPPVQPVCAMCVAFLLLQGWGMTLNAHWLFDPDYSRFVPVVAPWPAGPGTVDRAASVAMLWRVSALLGVICLVGEMAIQAIWRRRIWWTVTLSGTSVVLLGLVQKVVGAPLLPFEGVKAGSLYFATFYYHGNAGAFINLVLPLAVGLAALASRKSAAAHRLLVPCAVICMAGVFTNTSRAAAGVSALLLCILAVWLARASRWDFRALSRRAVLLYVALALLILGIIVLAVLPAERWARLPGQINADNPRWVSLKILLRMVPDAGAWGLGPGTFHLTFPHYTRELGTAIRGIWRFAHQDYLQTVIEWGWVGSGAWAVLFFGGLIRCFRSSRRVRSADRALLFTSGLALTGVALHAWVDFPLQIASLQLYVAVYLGLGWSSGTWQDTERQASPPRTPIIG